MAESTLAQAKQSNISPPLPMGHRTVFTHFWADNFDHKIETQQGGKMVNTTHLMAFQETIEDCNVFLNTNDDYQVPRTKHWRVEYEQGDVPNPIINKSQEPPKFDKAFSLNHFNSLFFFWLCFHKWNSHDQAVAIFSDWLTQVREKRYPNQHTVKTTEIYLPPLVLEVTESSTIQKYVEYLQSLAATVNMSYVNIIVDVAAALNAFKFLQNRVEQYQNVLIHLGNFHFMTENFQVLHAYKNHSSSVSTIIIYQIYTQSIPHYT